LENKNPEHISAPGKCRLNTSFAVPEMPIHEIKHSRPVLLRKMQRIERMMPSSSLIQTILSVLEFHQIGPKVRGLYRR
jgi:hypothetical protein